MKGERRDFSTLEAVAVTLQDKRIIQQQRKGFGLSYIPFFPETDPPDFMVTTLSGGCIF